MDTWTAFSEFVSLEKAVGGPDPHMAVVGHLSRNESWEERAWRAGCYIGAYNVPGAEFIWTAWPWERARVGLDSSLGAFEEWTARNWPIPTRRERRAVRRPEQMARFLFEYARWVADLSSKPWITGGRPQRQYEEAWLDVQTVYTLGRYVALKLLEFYRRYLGIAIELPDMRPKDGWSPREGLALLYPDHAPALLGDDRQQHLDIVNNLADIVGMRQGLDRYETQVLLCDFKQSWNGRQYPGRSIDSELDYWSDLWEHHQNDGIANTGMFGARTALFQERSLGEVSGWTGVRKPLTKVLREHGYTWSDTRYDWATSKDDLAHPVVRVDYLKTLLPEPA